MQPDKRNRAALVFCCLLVFLCTACDSANKAIILPAITKAPASKQIFVKPILGSPGYVTLDPALVTDLPSASIVNMLYEGLVEISDNGGIQKTLAQNYSEGPDGLTWTFVVTDMAHNINVNYRGILPDLFKEGKGVVAEGKL